MEKFKNFIALYFNLTRKESNGFIILCILILFLLLVPMIFNTWLFPDRNLQASDKKILDSIVLLMNEQKTTQPNLFVEGNTQQITTDSNLKFDPNSASEELMIKAGTPSFVAKRIVKFRSKGGRFNTTDDLKKIYGLTPATFEKISGSIVFFESRTKNKYTENSKQPDTKSESPFDINKVDSSRLVKLRGIGPVLAARIIKYRTKLGGYISMAQLKEVYGLDSAIVSDLKKHSYIEQNFTPLKININTLSNKTSTHPYLNKKTIQLIVNYREQHGKYTSLGQLKNIPPIQENEYQKIFPYLTAE